MSALAHLYHNGWPLCGAAHAPLPDAGPVRQCPSCLLQYLKATGREADARDGEVSAPRSQPEARAMLGDELYYVITNGLKGDATKYWSITQGAWVLNRDHATRYATPLEPARAVGGQAAFGWMADPRAALCAISTTHETSVQHRVLAAHEGFMGDGEVLWGIEADGMLWSGKEWVDPTKINRAMLVRCPSGHAEEMAMLARSDKGRWHWVRIARSRVVTTLETERRVS